MALFFAIISHLGWAIGDLFVVKVARKMGTYPATLWGMIFAFALYCLMAPFFASDFLRLDWSSFALIMLLSLFLLGGHTAFNHAFQAGNASLVGMISASFVAVSVLLSVIFLGESLSLEKGLLIALTFFGVLLCLMQKDFQLEFGKGEWMAVITMICWGIYYAFIKIAIDSVGWFVPSFLFLTLFPLLLFFRPCGDSVSPSPFGRNILVILIPSVILIGIAELSFNVTLDFGNVVSVLPIAGSYPALFILLSSLVFKEKMLAHQWFGVFLALIGVIALSIL